MLTSEEDPPITTSQLQQAPTALQYYNSKECMHMYVRTPTYTIGAWHTSCGHSQYRLWLHYGLYDNLIDQPDSVITNSVGVQIRFEV